MDDDINEVIALGNIDSEDLKDVALAINRLSVATVSVHPYDYETNLKEISDNTMKKIVEENEDLKRQNILLEQKLNAAERHIKYLEKSLVVTEKQTFPRRNYKQVNTASQVHNLNA